MVSNIKHLFAQGRTELMGIAIVMVLLYHLYSLCPVESLNLFRHWYAGVDIFMFLSGWGLCYSYKNHSLPAFYKRRVLRILPLYIFQVVVANVILSIVKGGDCSSLASHILEELQTLPNMSIGGDFGNWYTSAILILYLTFPILYYVVRKFSFISFVAVGLTSCLVVHHFPDMPWQYNCFLSRIPAFVLGISMYNISDNEKEGLSLILATIMFLSLSYSYGISNYLTTSFITLICIFSIVSVFRVKTDAHSIVISEEKNNCTLPISSARECMDRVISPYFHRLLSFCGKYTYELFLSNRLTALTILLLMSDRLREHNNVFILSCCYVTFTIFYGYIFVVANKIISKIHINGKK